MWQIFTAWLNKNLSVKLRAGLSLVLIIGGLSYCIIDGWDEMISNIKNGRSIPQPYHINKEVCLKKKNFRQVGDQIIETLESDVEILELKQGIKRHKPLYYANVKLLNLGFVVEVDMTEEMFKQLSVGEIWFLHREVYYGPNGWSTDIVDKLTKKENITKETVTN